jgi:hypothetical protein
VRSRSLQEVREHRNALGRLLLLALQPYPRRPALTNTIVNLVGLVALPIITWVVGDLLLGAVVFLSVAVLLLLIAGTRVERQLHGDLGIQLDPKVSGHWIELGVRNGRRKTASFNATVESIEPAPPLRYPPRWAVPWFGCDPPASTEASFLIDLEPDGSDTARPRIMLISEPRSTWG